MRGPRFAVFQTWGSTDSDSLVFAAFHLTCQLGTSRLDVKSRASLRMATRPCIDELPAESASPPEPRQAQKARCDQEQGSRLWHDDKLLPKGIIHNACGELECSRSRSQGGERQSAQNESSWLQSSELSWCKQRDLRELQLSRRELRRRNRLRDIGVTQQGTKRNSLGDRRVGSKLTNRSNDPTDGTAKFPRPEICTCTLIVWPAVTFWENGLKLSETESAKAVPLSTAKAIISGRRPLIAHFSVSVSYGWQLDLVQ